MSVNRDDHSSNIKISIERCSGSKDNTILLLEAAVMVVAVEDTVI